MVFLMGQGCQRIVEDWQKIIQVHSLVVSPEEDVRTWLKYSSLCRKSGRLALSHKMLVALLQHDPSTNADHPLPTANPHVTYAYTKHLWMSNQVRPGQVASPADFALGHTAVWELAQLRSGLIWSTSIWSV